MKKIFSLFPLLTIGATTGLANMPVLELADIQGVFGSVSAGMQNFIASALVIIPIVLILFYGYKIIEFLFKKTRLYDAISVSVYNYKSYRRYAKSRGWK